MGWESFGVVRFDLGPLIQGQTRIAKPKSAYRLPKNLLTTSLIMFECTHVSKSIMYS